MLRGIIVYVLVLIGLASYGQQHYCLKIGSTSLETAGRSASLPSGTTFHCGTSSGKLRLNTSFSDDASAGMYIASIDRSGTAAWLKKFPFSGIARARALDVLENSLFLCGEFEGTISIGAQQLNSENGLTAFVAELDTLGNVMWATRVFSAGTLHANAVAALPQGGCVLAGSFEGTLGIEDMLMLSEGGSDYYTIQFLNTGDFGTFAVGGGAFDDAITAIKIGPDGTQILGGYYGNNASLGGMQYTAQGQRDAFLARINSQNTWEWTRTLGSAQDDEISDVCLKGTSIAATGFISAFCTIDGIELSPLGASDALLWIVNQTDGASEYAKIYGDSGEERGTGVCSSASGNLFLSGEYTESFFADAQVVIHHGLRDAFIFELNGGYFVADIRTIGSSGNENISGIAALPGNSCVADGTFEKHCRFGQTAMSATQTDSYCMSFNQETTVVDGLLTSSFNTANSGLSSNNINHLSVDAQNRLWVSTADSGLSVFDGNSWTGYHSGNSPLPNEINSTFHAADGKVYIGTPANGLFVFDGLEFINYTTSNSQIGFNNINSITSKNPSIIWMGTPDSGCVRLNTIGFGPFNTGNSALGSNTVRELDYDTSGGTWVATLNGGISRFFAGSFNVFNTQNSNLPGDSVLAVHTNKVNNTTYAVTNNGVARYTGTDWQDEDLGADFIGIPINDFTTTPSAYVAAGGKKKGGTISTPIVQRIVNTDNVLYENEVAKVLSDTNGNVIWLATQSTGLVKVEIETTTGVEKPGKAADIVVQPNPVQDVLTIPFNALDTFVNQIDVFDANGRLVLNECILANAQTNIQLDFGAFPAGAYTIKAIGKKGISTGRFMKIGK
jgi:hypothetical protein